MFTHISLAFVLISCCFGELELGQRCSVSDSKCQKDFFQGLPGKFGGTGIPLLGIPVIDPFALSDVSLNFLPFDVTLIEGESPGITTCKLLDYKIKKKKNRLYAKSEIICDLISIKGNYTATLNPFVELLIGQNINGNGYINMDLEGWYFKIEYPFEFVRREDGNIYVNGNFNEAKYKSGEVKNARITADGIKIDDLDISDLFNDFFNKNWKYLMSQKCAQPFYDKSMEYFYDTYAALFDQVPASLFYSDDLTKYVENSSCPAK